MQKNISLVASKLKTFVVRESYMDIAYTRIPFNYVNEKQVNLNESRKQKCNYQILFCFSKNLFHDKSVMVTN